MGKHREKLGKIIKQGKDSGSRPGLRIGLRNTKGANWARCKSRRSTMVRSDRV